MNERIKELIEQCTTIEYGVDNGFDRMAFDQEKFAKLIVQESMNIVSKSGNSKAEILNDLEELIWS